MMNYPAVCKPEPAPWVPSDTLVHCPACKGTGWIIGALREKTRPCLDQECIDGNGSVPDNYKPKQPVPGPKPL